MYNFSLSLNLLKFANFESKIILKLFLTFSDFQN